MKFTCSCCGLEYDGIPAIGFDAPVYWHNLTEAEKADGSLTPDYCEINGFYFVRGVLELPLIDVKDEHFEFTAWCSVSEKSYTEIRRRESQGIPLKDFSCFAWLNTNLSNYGFQFDQDNPAELSVEYHNNKHRPQVRLPLQDNSLYSAQNDGISIQDVKAWIEKTHKG